MMYDDDNDIVDGRDEVMITLDDGEVSDNYKDGSEMTLHIVMEF